MPDVHQPDDHRPDRTAAERSADHAAMHRLTDELLPALVAKLGATDLGELEVREGAWRVRLRRDSGASAPIGRDKRKGSGAGTGGGTLGDRERGDAGSDRPGHHPVQSSSTRTDTRTVATSPAVGIYRPRADLAAGTRVRAGDRIGAVDMLGVAQEVVAPANGIVGASLAQGGDAVEYGQELMVIEFAGSTSPTSGAPVSSSGAA